MSQRAVRAPNRMSPNPICERRRDGCAKRGRGDLTESIVEAERQSSRPTPPQSGRRFILLGALKTILTVVAAVVLAAGAGAAAEILDSFDVAPGLKYARYSKDGLIAHVLKLDLKTKALQLRSVKSRGKETVRQLVERVNAEGALAVAAINGDFFRQETAAGLPFGVQVTDGRLVFAPMKRSMIAFRANNEPWIGIAGLRARLTIAPKAKRGPPQKWTPVDDVNPTENEIRGRSGIFLYTPAFMGLSLSRPNGLIAVVDPIVPALQVGDVCEAVVTRIEASDKPVEVPEAGCLLYFFGDAARALARAVKPGQGMAIEIDLPPLPTGAVSQAIGGGPRLIRDGKVAVELDKESFDPAHAMELSKRHPRSAIGFDRPRQGLYLVMVEGRHEDSRGMTFGELAKFLADLGCYQAMAFDGGGSAGMYVAGKGLVSKSMGGSGQSEEREIANALLIALPNAGTGKKALKDAPGKAAPKAAPAAPAPPAVPAPPAPTPPPQGAPPAAGKEKSKPGGNPSGGGEPKPWDP